MAAEHHQQPTAATSARLVPLALPRREAPHVNGKLVQTGIGPSRASNSTTSRIIAWTEQGLGGTIPLHGCYGRARPSPEGMSRPLEACPFGLLLTRLTRYSARANRAREGRTDKTLTVPSDSREHSTSGEKQRQEYIEDHSR